MFTRLHPDVRKWTVRLQEAMDAGTMDPRDIADMCLMFMSEGEVEDMCISNYLMETLDPEYDAYSDQDDDEEDDSLTQIRFAV